MAASSSLEITEGLLSRPHDYAWVRSKDPSSYSENVKAPITGATTTIGAQTATSMFQFLIQRDVQNLHRSVLTGTYTLTAPNAGPPALVGFIANRPWIDSIQLTNSSGSNLVLLNYAQEYTQICRLRHMTWDKWLRKQLSDHGCPSRVSKLSAQALVCVPTAIPLTTSSAVPSMIAVAASQLDVDTYAPLMIRSVPAAAIIVTNFTWQLGDLFPDTLFGCDLDLRFPEDLTLTVNIAAEQNFFWSANTQGDATLGAAVPNGGVGTLTAFKLRLMVQTNVRRREEVIALCRAGLILPIPYTLSYRYAIAANAGSMSQDIPLGSGLGSECRYICTAFFDQTRTLSNSCNCSNIDGQTTFGKISSYQTKIGSTLLQVAPLNCTPTIAGFTGIYTDYEWNRKLGGDSPLYQSRLTYQQYFHHVDDFRNSMETGREASIQKSMILGGIPLSGISGAEQIVYNFSATMPAVTSALVMHAWPTFTKTLQWTDSLILML